jgi:hypothetical protein
MKQFDDPQKGIIGIAAPEERFIRVGRRVLRHEHGGCARRRQMFLILGIRQKGDLALRSVLDGGHAGDVDVR